MADGREGREKEKEPWKGADNVEVTVVGVEGPVAVVALAGRRDHHPPDELHLPRRSELEALVLVRDRLPLSAERRRDLDVQPRPDL